MNLRLIREKPQPQANCSLGLLFGPGDLSLVTLERPWIPSAVGKGGQKGVSCVPLGTYRLVPHNTEAHPMTWALVNEALDVLHMPDDDHPAARTAVLIHPANYVEELRGCIAPGTRTAMCGPNRYMVQESRRAMDLIRQRLPYHDDHTISIEERIP